MKPAEALKERANLGRSNMKRALAAILAVIMTFFAASIGIASAGDSEPLFYAETTKETRVREKTSKTSALVATVQAGTEVSVLEEVKGKDGKIWYRIQMEYYGKALRMMERKEVREMILWSFSLGKAISL